MTHNYLPDVQQQYELLPYPPVDPEDERKRLQRTWLEDLPMLNHYCFAGRQDFRQGFRALAAGGGTGDATIYLAHQLRGTNAEIVHLDLSAASIDIAARRAALRGLDNIRFVQASLLDLPTLGLGRFDYINCSGVLHHLADPDAGLQALRAVLADGGALGLMVYGAIGRHGIYQMQHMLRALLPAGASAADKLACARELLNNLPAGNWFKRGEDLYGDSRRSDADLYDMLLHSQDRAYTVTELHEWLADRNGLHLALSDVQRGRFPYLPEMTLPPGAAALRARLPGMSARARHAMSELFLGDLTRHTLYATASAASVAPYGERDMVPFFFHEPLTGAALAPVFTSRDGGPITLHHAFLGLTTQIDAGRYAPLILPLVDGVRSFGDIFDRLRSLPALRHAAPSDAALFADFQPSYDALNAIERLLLRHRATPVPQLA